MSVAYRVVFQGKIGAGQEPKVVRERLLQLYKGNAEAVQRFFSGREVVVKDRLDRETALKYKTVFGRAGVEVVIVPIAPVPLELTMEEPQLIAGEEAGAETGEAPAAPTPHPAQATVASPGLSMNLVALAVILLICASLGLRFWASNKLDHFVSIDHVAANRDQVAIHAAGTIYLLSPAGILEQALELDDLGLTGPLADLELLDDGSLLVGDLEMKKILRCDPGTRSCQPFAPLGALSLADNFKFLADQERQLLYIADTNNDRLLVQNLADSSCAIAETTSRLSYPNDLARDGGDRLYLCDTNRFRIIPFQIKKETVSEVGEPLRTMPGGLPVSPEDLEELARDPERLKAELANLKENLGQFAAESQHAKPFALAWGADDNLWVARLNTVMSDGTIKVIAANGEPVGTITLEQGAVPVDLARLDRSILAVDSGLIRAYTIDPETYFVSAFGDQPFRAELERVAGHRAWLENFKRLGLIGTIFFGLAALGVVVVAKKQGLA